MESTKKLLRFLNTFTFVVFLQEQMHESRLSMAPEEIIFVSHLSNLFIFVLNISKNGRKT